MAPPDLLDLPTLQNLVDLDDGGDGLLQEMIDIFRDDTPRRLRDILSAVTRGDAEDFSRAAHALKGGAGALGARSLRSFAADLEAMGRQGSVEVATDLQTHLEGLFQDTLAALEAYVRALKGA